MRRGLTLVELVVTIAVAGVIALAILGLLRMGLLLVADDKARNGALALAEDTLELVKNLPYEKVGTVNGIPTGALPQNETRLLNNIPYSMTTSIRYIDDDLDGLAPQDAAPNDYKRAQIDVSWTSRLSAAGLVTLVTDVSPPGLETDLAGGTIKISVVDANNNPVPQTRITIDAPSANPPVALVTTTDDAGFLSLPGAPPCAACYHITATKNGYSLDSTVSPELVAQPTRPDLSITDKAVVASTFFIDRTAQLTVRLRSVGPPVAPIANLPFLVRGSKTIGKDGFDQPVWKFTGQFTTSTSGHATAPALEWDSYQILMTENPTYDIAETNPLLPINLPPADSETIEIMAMPHTPQSLRLAVREQNNEPIADALIQLTPDGGGTIEKTTSAVGQTFYSGLGSGGHTLIIQKNGFQNQTLELDITGNQNILVTLVPI